MTRSGPGRPGESARRCRALARAVLADKGTICHLCRTDGATTVDHVVPVAAGGQWTFDNLLPAHQACNAARKAIPLAEWFARHPVPRQPDLPPSREW